MWLGDFWRSAGLFAIPILILGGITLWLSIRYLRGRASHPGAAVAMIFATILTGVLGMVMGFQMGLEHLTTLSPDNRFLIGIGMKEAMNDLVLSLMFALPSTLLLAFGSARSNGLDKAAPAPNGPQQDELTA